MPIPFISSYTASYPGRCVDEQVGVKAPGRENITILRRANGEERSDERKVVS